MRISVLVGSLVVAGLWLGGSETAFAKTKDPCRKADAKLARTGQGDTDGDGLSDCRERSLLHTFPNDRDSDDDAMDDGEEVHHGCDPLDPDSDHDGMDDGEDDTPALHQEVKALLDAVSCPQTETAGSITALGISAALNQDTEFEDASCAELASLLGSGESVLVKIEVLEDMLGALTATEVELKRPDLGDHHEDGDDDDQGEDED